MKEDGIARMSMGIEAFRAADAVIMLPYFCALLAEVYGKAGQAEEGLRVLEGVDHTHEQYWEAELYRVKGELILILTGDPA